jgi:uncharacterized short protein YbdD (DUF466 family)
MLIWLKKGLSGLCQTALLMIGLPDYKTYVDHRLNCHPDQPIMSEQEFFKNRQAARYGEGKNKITRCC